MDMRASGLPYREVARVMGTTPGVVAGIVSRYRTDGFIPKPRGPLRVSRSLVEQTGPVKPASRALTRKEKLLGALNR